MNIQNVYQLFNNLKQDNLSFVYHGNFNDEITERIIDISETTIASRHEEHKISNKVSFLLAECFQNVIRHGGATQEQASLFSSGIFVTRNIGKSYYISSANLIANEEVEKLREKIEHLNNMSPEELKRLYLDVLEYNTITNKGGAGLGLIEMARKSKQKLDYDFEQVDSHYSYFYLQVKLNSPSEEDTGDKLQENVAKEFHQMLTMDNIFIIHKGDFSQHTIIPILRMIEENLYKNQERNSYRKRVFHVLVEILQNVSKHGVETNGVKEGIFMMGQKDGHFLIYTGNYIFTSKTAPLAEHLDNLNSMEKPELVELYKLNLHLGATNAQGDAGLGLIDIAREGYSKFQYEFIPVSDSLSFFSLGIFV
ncbi:MAG TPA: SiaB family protein kinase [Bacteroidales bacterium]|nr:SiaB family protein kinase [Bacteroidales bacterium]